MTIEEILGEVYSVTTDDLLPQTDILTKKDKERWNSRGYAVGFTEQEWREKYPRIDSKYIFYAPLLSSSTMVYYDEENIVWLNLPFLGDQEISSVTGKEGLENTVLKLAEEQKQCFQKKEFKKLVDGMPDGVQIEILFKISQVYQGPELYQLFKYVYQTNTCFTSNVPEDFGEMLLKSKTEEQRKQTAERLKNLPKNDDGQIIIYRGAANKSTPPEKALSWTPDINTAYFFASRMGEEPVVLKGTVEEGNIIEYFDEETTSAEVEIIVVPGSVCVEQTLDLYEPRSEKVVDTTNEIVNIYGDFKTLTKEVYKKMGNRSGIHAVEHSVRVILYALLIGWLAGLNDDDLETLAIAGAYHDIGRIDDLENSEHGEASKKIFQKKAKEENWSYRQEEVAGFLMEFHCRSDEEAKMAAQHFSNPNQVLKLLWIFKDADALDRLRIGFCASDRPDGLDVRQLRLRNSKRLVPVAWKAIRYIEV